MSAIPPKSCGYTPSDCADGNCIDGAITTQTQLLLSTQCAATTENTQALQFLAHFHGDITQPLHNVARGRGGNDDKLSFGSMNTNFHAIHDSSIPEKRAAEVGADGYEAYAQFLDKTYGGKKDSYIIEKFIDLVNADSTGKLKAVIVMTFNPLSR